MHTPDWMERLRARRDAGMRFLGSKRSRQQQATRRATYEPLEPRLVLTVGLRPGPVPDDVVLYPAAQVGDFQIAADPIRVEDQTVIDLSQVTEADQRHRLPLSNDSLVRVDANEFYTVSTRAFNDTLIVSGPSDNGLQIASFDIDRLQIEPLHVAKYSFAADTFLAAALNPGDTALWIDNASGWSNDPWDSAETRALAWYGYTDSTGHTYEDYTYTRNVASDFDGGLWEPGAIRYDRDAGAYRIDLLQPWEGPALETGEAVRNAANAVGFGELSAATSQSDENLWVDYTATVGGGVWQAGDPYTEQFLPGTAYIRPNILVSSDAVVGPAQDSAFGAVDDPTRATVSSDGDRRVEIDLDVLGKHALSGAVGPVEGDFDSDSDCDVDDLLAWQRGVGTSYGADHLNAWQEDFGEGASGPANGDLDSDGDWDIADLLAWQRGVGTSYGADHLNAWRENYGGAGVVSIASLQDPRHGTSTLSTDDNGKTVIHYRSDPWFVGTDVVGYTLQNSVTGKTFSGSVNIEVLGDNTEQDAAVVATLESQSQVVEGNIPPHKQQEIIYRIASGQTLLGDGVHNYSLLHLITDPTDQLVVRLLDGPTHGTLSVNFDGTFEYVSEAGYAGYDTFAYEAFDGLHTTTAVAAIRVLETPDDLLEHRLRSLGVAMLTYEANWGRFPIQDDPEYFDAEGNPHLSWRVHILPYLGYDALYDQFNLDEPWNSATNLPLVSQMPDVFRSIGDSLDSTTTRFQTLTGEDAPFGSEPAGEDQLGPSLRRFSDGSDHTLLFVESGTDKAVTWTKPDDLEFDINDPMASLGSITSDRINGVTADAATITFSSAIDPADFAALVTIDGEEIVDAGTIRRQYKEVSGTICQ